MLLKTDSAAATRESVAELMDDRLGVLAEAGVLTCGMVISTRLPTSMCSVGARSVPRWIGFGPASSPSKYSGFVFSEGDKHQAVILDVGGRRKVSMRLMPDSRSSFLTSKFSLAAALSREIADFGFGDCVPFLFCKLLVTNADFGRLNAMSIPIFTYQPVVAQVNAHFLERNQTNQWFVSWGWRYLTSHHDGIALKESLNHI